MQYLTQHPSKRAPKKGLNASYVCRWSIAAGKRPVPFRTRKLSLHTLMVLQPGGCGRVSHRRHQTTTTQYSKGRGRTTTGLFPFSRFAGASVTRRNTWPTAHRHHSSSLRFIAINCPRRTVEDSQLVVCPRTQLCLVQGIAEKAGSVIFPYSLVNSPLWFYVSPRDSIRVYTIAARCDRLSGVYREEGRTQTPGTSR